MSDSVNWCYCWASGPHWVGLCSSLHKYGFSQFYILIGCPRQKCVLFYKNGWKQHSQNLNDSSWHKCDDVEVEKSSAMCKCAMWDLKLKWIRSIFYSHVQSHTLNNPYVCTTIWNKKPEYSNLSSLWVVVTSVLKKNKLNSVQFCVDLIFVLLNLRQDRVWN